MSESRQQALDLLKSYYATFNGGNRADLLALLNENVVHDINQGGRETGVAAFTKFLERMDRCYHEQVEELEVFANDEGTRGSAEFFINGTYQQTDDGLPEATGQKYRIRVGAFFRFREGKISRVTNYYNLEEWLHVIGA